MESFIVNLDNDEVKFQILRDKLQFVCKKSICHPDNSTKRMQPNKFIYVKENAEDVTYLNSLSHEDKKIIVPYTHAIRMIDQFLNRKVTS
jgi:hypothetical protein